MNLARPGRHFGSEQVQAVKLKPQMVSFSTFGFSNITQTLNPTTTSQNDDNDVDEFLHFSGCRLAHHVERRHHIPCTQAQDVDQPCVCRYVFPSYAGGE